MRALNCIVLQNMQKAMTFQFYEPLGFLLKFVQVSSAENHSVFVMMVRWSAVSEPRASLLRRLRAKHLASNRGYIGANREWLVWGFQLWDSSQVFVVSPTRHFTDNRDPWYLRKAKEKEKIRLKEREEYSERQLTIQFQLVMAVEAIYHLYYYFCSSINSNGTWTLQLFLKVDVRNESICANMQPVTEIEVKWSEKMRSNQ